MFVVTFYSYKGGVGRSLALANVAGELARRGKSVLVVDFDLEAPGANSFQSNGCSENSSEEGGIVDFVLSWLRDDVSPDIRKYVYECKNADPSCGSIWVMPAGRMDGSYGGRLHQIDFNDLYENHDGFLLIEDLKAQWKEALEVDYVLIDSRTGHTDIGGICTRQLPDLVVFVFWPNSQNLLGLSYIVDELNTDEKDAGRSINRIFVPSNLPTLDDEEEVLKRLLSQFQAVLKYERSQEIRLQHYPSLELLEQKIFTVHRPNSRLGREYSRLTNAIQRQNPLDEDGVRLFLERVLGLISRSGGEIGEASEGDQRRLEEMHQSWIWDDPRVNRMLGFLKAGEGDFAQAIQRIEGIISAKKAKLVDYYYLASWLMSSTAVVDPRDAIVDPREAINRLLDDPEAGQKEVLAAIRLISKFELQTEYTDIATRRAVSALSSRQLAKVASSVQDDELQTNIVAEIVNTLMVSNSKPDSELFSLEARHDLGLCLISAGHFAAAVRIYGESKSPVSDNYKRLAALFNLAVATWGRDGAAPTELFQQVVDAHRSGELKKGYEDANYNQCLSLAYAAVNETEPAIQFLRKAKELIGKGAGAFSCWSYLKRGQYAFIVELDEMDSWILSRTPPPRFLDRGKGSSRDHGDRHPA